MFCVYIIFSEKLNKFYIGTTDDFEKRLFEHNNGLNAKSFSFRGRPWTKHFVIDHLTSKTAYAIEKHIKSMKSSKYIENLIKYPEIIEKLKYKYDPVRSR
jgi:putative endonuclease